MDDVVKMEILQSYQDTGNKELGLIFPKPASAAHVIPEVASNEKVHNQVQVLSILKGICHVDDERVFQLREQLSLIED